MLKLLVFEIQSGKDVPWDVESQIGNAEPSSDSDIPEKACEHHRPYYLARDDLGTSCGTNSSERHLDSFLEGPNDDLPFETEISQIATDVEEVIQCLFRLSVTIRNPAPHDRYKQSSRTDALHFEPFDIGHVRARFPKTSDALAQKLGKANSQRRQYFNYRKLHHEKLSCGIDLDDGETSGSGFESTIASSIPKSIKVEGQDGEQPDYLDEDAYSSGCASQTSFESSLVDTGARKIPPLPKESAKGPFECPFCYMIISASTTRAWRYATH